MSKSKYGVLIGKVKKIEPDLAEERTPHYMITVDVSENNCYEIAINCQSSDENHQQILYHCDEDCDIDEIKLLKEMGYGFHEVDFSRDINAHIAIDYTRGGLVKKDDMESLPYDIKGDNDLKGFIDRNLKKAVDNDNVVIYVYGTMYSNCNGKGIHNVHMNQGNRDKHYDENSIYHDGCFFINFLEEEKWVAYYLAFQNQSWNTDKHGNPRD